jgi:hypothetical protein
LSIVARHKRLAYHFNFLIEDTLAFDVVDGGDRIRAGRRRIGRHLAKRRHC